MEGATSVVHKLKNGWVRKTLKRKAKKSNSHSAVKQIEIQQWSSKTLNPENGYKLLFTPEARVNANKNSILMKEVDTSKPIHKIKDAGLVKEILAYFAAAKKSGYYPSDFELYEQPDGRIALLDFDKYGILTGSKRRASFPFRGAIRLNEAPVEAIYTEDLSEKIKNVMRGAGRTRVNATRKR
jgi:hypothetical protein